MDISRALVAATVLVTARAGKLYTSLLVMCVCDVVNHAELVAG